MDLLPHLLRLAAGIGLFLFAMYLLEESLRNLSGRRFKLLLQKITKNRYGAAAGGALVTAILQSSSMVSLMVLAFVGAGIFSMRTALALILGANLGTTASSWIVATIGFSMDLELIAYPAICVGGILLMVGGKRKTTRYISFFLLGFGLLFVALAFMKTAMEGQVQNFNLGQFNDMPLLIFLALGFVITVIVQSSNVTMALTLSALHTGALGFAPAAALVLGSEVGTIIKLLISAIGGGPVKKRVALGNFTFNLLLMIVVFALLKPILWIITDLFAISDPLIGLALFSTLTNLMGILLFLPFLDPFARFLERFFKGSTRAAAAYIGQAIATEPETALDLFRREANYLVYNAMRFNLEQFGLDRKVLPANPEFKQINVAKKLPAMDLTQKYDFLKELTGELQAFYLTLRAKMEGGAGIVELNQLISAVRSAMYSTKCIKDIGNNIDNLNSSSKEIKYSFFQHHQSETRELYLQLANLMQATPKDTNANEALQQLYHLVENNYQESLNDFYQNALTAKLEDVDMTIVLNFNRELFTSNKAIVMAVKDMLLDEKQAEAFNSLPVYRT